MFPIPDIVRNKAIAVGRDDWIETLPDVVNFLKREWNISIGSLYKGGTEAIVLEAWLPDRTPAVLKILVPSSPDAARNEIVALRLANGDGCVKLLNEHEEHGALLLERLGRSLASLRLPLEQRQLILCTTVERMWRPAAGFDLPTGADKGRWLIDFITSLWDELDHPCEEQTVDYVVACALRRVAAHRDEKSVLVHGDVHVWNALESDGSFKLIDPDGLLAEAEYDMGILMREDPEELLVGDARDRARLLAKRCDLDPEAIWEWGAVERVSTGLLCVQVGMEQVGLEMLSVANRLIE